MTLIDSERGFMPTVGLSLIGKSNSFGIANETALTFKVLWQTRKGTLSFNEWKEGFDG